MGRHVRHLIMQEMGNEEASGIQGCSIQDSIEIRGVDEKCGGHPCKCDKERERGGEESKPAVKESEMKPWQKANAARRAKAAARRQANEQKGVQG